MADDSIQPASSDDTDPEDVTSTAAVAPASLSGWNAFRYSVNTVLPDALTKAQGVRQATLRVLSGG